MRSLLAAQDLDLQFIESKGSPEELMHRPLFGDREWYESMDLESVEPWRYFEREYRDIMRELWLSFSQGRPNWEMAEVYLRRWFEDYQIREALGLELMPTPTPEPEPEEIVRTIRKLKNPPVIQHDGIAESLTEGAKRCADALCAFLTAGSTRPPLTVAVEAPWGGGKSSLMRHVQRQLASDGYPTVWFNPWKYEAGRSLWAAFALALERQLAQRYGLCDRIIMWSQTVLSRLTLREWLLLGGRLSFWLALIFLLSWAAKKGLWSQDTKKDDLWGLLKSYSPGVGAIAAAWAFLSDMTKQLGSPLKLDMDNLITGAARSVPPDELHRFHQDFRRLLRAYLPIPNRDQPPRRTVIVFIDDLDRCEAPKAADLLQSLHLLMDLEEDESASGKRTVTRNSGTPEPGLIYILGIDREKVSAAVAAKHEKLLDLLYDPPAGQTKLARSQKMSFGHEFLEKFVNLTLHLPAMQGRDLLTFSRQITGWRPVGEDRSPGEPPATGRGPAGAMEEFGSQSSSVDSNAPSGPPSSHVLETIMERVEDVRRAQRIREVQEELDVADELQPWVCAVAPMLENNPRKLKQFVNLLRLRLYLAASADLLDMDESKSNRLTVHHLAKLVALELADPGAMASIREKNGNVEDLKTAYAGRAGAEFIFSTGFKPNPSHDLQHISLISYFHSIAAEASATTAPDKK